MSDMPSCPQLQILTRHVGHAVHTWALNAAPTPRPPQEVEGSPCSRRRDQRRLVHANVGADEVARELSDNPLFSLRINLAGGLDRSAPFGKTVRARRLKRSRRTSQRPQTYTFHTCLSLKAKWLPRSLDGNNVQKLAKTARATSILKRTKTTHTFVDSIPVAHIGRLAGSDNFQLLTIDCILSQTLLLRTSFT